MMGSFKLKVEKRNKLYFNKFKYRATLKIQGAAYTYYTPNLETFISRMEKLRTNTNRYGVRIINEDWKEYWDEVNLDQISQFITWRNVVDKSKCMHRIQGDTVSFFSNDLSLLQTLDSINTEIFYSEAISLKPNIMYFKKQPKFKFRTYFRSKRMPKDFSDNVRSLSSMYQNVLNFSPALFNALFYQNQYNPYRYLHGSYYVEYNDDKMLTILAMWFPDMLAKTYSLAKEP
jgi:hypothetical protein